MKGMGFAKETEENHVWAAAGCGGVGQKKYKNNWIYGMSEVRERV